MLNALEFSGLMLSAALLAYGGLLSLSELASPEYHVLAGRVVELTARARAG